VFQIYVFLHHLLRKNMALSKKNSSALSEKDGVAMPSPINPKVAAQVQSLRKKTIDIDQLSQDLLAGDITALSQGITLIESTQAKHQEMAAALINHCLPYANKSIRIGITGVPGVGKSTFIEAFGNYLTSQGKKVAVLAVDPSSSLSHGSILGDKTRMEELVKNPMAYIRPSAAGTTLGGVARKTRETILLCEASGFDTILIETVGVGQSETAVHSLVDFFLLLKIAGAGDELQGIKRGIMEMADAIVINKADGDNLKKAQLARAEFARALHLFPAKSSSWQPQVRCCSALTQDGIPAIEQLITEYVTSTKASGFFVEKRSNQNQYWMMETIQEQLNLHFFSNPERMALVESYKKAVMQNEISPFEAAQKVLTHYFSS